MAISTGVTNLPELNRAIKTFIKAYEYDIGKSIRKIGINAFARFQINTPRDTGRAINGWNVRIDRPPSEWKPPPNQNSYVRLSFPGQSVKFNSIINISNNVEYIIPLEEGHSIQKPSGFMQMSINSIIAEALAEANRIRRNRYGL